MLLGSFGSRFDGINQNFSSQVLDDEALVAGLLFDVLTGILLISSINVAKTHRIGKTLLEEDGTSVSPVFHAHTLYL